MGQKRVLLLHISNISGHLSASNALKKALHLENPHLHIDILNAAGYTNPMLEKLVNHAYMSIIKRAPDIWNYLYDNPRIIEKSQDIHHLINKYNSQRFDRIINTYRPDFVVCTQAFPCSMAANFKRTGRGNFSLMGVLTDFAPHAFWRYKEVDHYIVPARDIGKKFIQSGISPARIHSFGIPIDPVFDSPTKKNGLYQTLHFSESVPCVLIMGGGQGLGPITKVCLEIDRDRDLNVQCIVLTGTNQKLFKKLSHLKKVFQKNFAILPYSDNVNALMDAADVIVTKPGGVTVQEAIAKRLPIIISSPLPGQEIMNTKYLLKKRSALLARSPHDVLVYLKDIFDNPYRMNIMKNNMERHFETNTSRKIAQYIISKL